MRVSLTFDNGPTVGVTDRVLDVLGERGLRASFFVVGTQLERPGARALAERAVAEGHLVGNHSRTHTVQLGLLDDARIADEIDGAAALIGPLAGAERWFRPFGGGGIIDERLLGERALTHLRRGGWSVVTWNSVPRDWEEPVRYVERCRREVAALDWAVVVLHDTPTGAMDQLGTLLDRLTDDGAELVGPEAGFPDDCVVLRHGAPVA